MTGLILAFVLALAAAIGHTVIELSHLFHRRRTAAAVLAPDALDEYAETYTGWWPDEEPADVVPGGALTDSERIDWLVTVDQLRSE